MRIAMIGQKGIPAIYGGIERHVEELSLELAKQGHTVLVYARKWYTPKNIKNYHGINIIHTPTLRTKHFDAIAHTFFSTIHAMFQKPDVIHYHGVGPSLLSWIPRVFSPKTKVVATVHCLDRYHQKWGLFARIMLRFGELVRVPFCQRNNFRVKNDSELLSERIPYFNFFHTQRRAKRSGNFQSGDIGSMEHSAGQIFADGFPPCETQRRALSA